jgi:hypothetical protein
MSSVEGCSRSGLGVSDGTGVGILKIGLVENGAFVDPYDEPYTAMADLMMNFHKEVVDHVGTS